MYGVHPRGTPVPDFQALPTEHNAQQVIEEQQQQQQQQQQQGQRIETGDEEVRMNGNRKIIRPA
eukprot:1148247-Pelagomonas_calceolata.AAC.3